MDAQGLLTDSLHVVLIVFFRLIRQLIDEQIVALSMSMSMSFVDPFVPPSSSVPTRNETDDNLRIDLLTTAPPTQSVSKENVTCDELLEIVASIDLEVETVAGKESFAQEVASALSQALSREYKACKSPSRRYRRLEKGSIFVGSVTVLLDQGEKLMLLSELSITFLIDLTCSFFLDHRQLCSPD